MVSAGSTLPCMRIGSFSNSKFQELKISFGLFLKKRRANNEAKHTRRLHTATVDDLMERKQNIHHTDGTRGS